MIVAVYKRWVKRGGKRVLLPYWYYDVTVNGRRERRSTGCPVTKDGKALAEQIEAKARLEMQEERHFGRSARRQMSVGMLRDLVIDEAREDHTTRLVADGWDRDLAEKEAQLRVGWLQSIWKRLASLLGENTSLVRINEERIEALTSELLASSAQRRGTTLRPGSVNRHLGLLHAALVRAHEKRAISRVPLIKLLTEENERDRIWTREEVDAFCSADPELGLAIEIGYWTCLRLGAIAELRWDGIDLVKRLMQVPRARSAGSRRRRRRKPRAPFVPLHHDLIAILRPIAQPDGPLFRSTGKQLGWRFSKVRDRLLEAEKLKDGDLRFHDLRHSGATNLLEAGADAATIMAIGGWRSMRSLVRYLAARPHHLLAAIDRIPGKSTPTPKSSGLDDVSLEELAAELARRIAKK
jgi:integrase